MNVKEILKSAITVVLVMAVVNRIPQIKALVG